MDFQLGCIYTLLCSFDCVFYKDVFFFEIFIVLERRICLLRNISSIQNLCTGLDKETLSSVWDNGSGKVGCISALGTVLQ